MEFLQSDGFMKLAAAVAFLALGWLGASRAKWKGLFTAVGDSLNKVIMARLSSSPGGKKITDEEMRAILLSIKQIPAELLKTKFPKWF